VDLIRRALRWAARVEVGGALAGAAAGLLLVAPPKGLVAVPAAAAFGWRLAGGLVARRARARAEEARAALPDALDLLAACALGGMAVDRALRTVAPEVPGPLGEALRETVRALDAGMPRRAAYRALAEQAGAPEVRSLVRALERAEQYGTPVAAALAAQAREVRARRRAEAEEAARRAPVAMLFPLVVCFLPAFLLLAVAPAVVVALRGFRAG
jgi:tight adherence protein C